MLKQVIYVYTRGPSEYRSQMKSLEHAFERAHADLRGESALPNTHPVKILDGEKTYDLTAIKQRP